MKKLISILLIILISLCPIIVNALSYTASLSAEEVELKPGETININLKLSNIDMDSGIIALGGELIFDENIFEPITVNSMGGILSSSLSKISALGSFGGIAYSPTTKKFTMDGNDFMTETNDVLKIMLKVKSGVTAKTTTVEIRNLVASNGDKDVEAGNASIKVGKENGDNQNPDDNNPDDNDPDNNNPGDNTGDNNGDNNNNSNTPGNNSNTNNGNNSNNGNGSNNKNNSSSNKVTNKQNNISSTTNKTSQGGTTKRLPNAGAATAIIAMIAILIVVATISYVRYRNMRNIK